MLVMPDSEYIFMYTIRSKTSFCCTHDCLTEFIGIGGHVSCGIESLHACFLAFIDDETSFSISISIERVDDFRKRCRSNGDKYSIESESLSGLEEDIFHSHHITPYFSDLRIVVEGDVLSFSCLVDPDILSTRSFAT